MFELFAVRIRNCRWMDAMAHDEQVMLRKHLICVISLGVIHLETGDLNGNKLMSLGIKKQS